MSKPSFLSARVWGKPQFHKNPFPAKLKDLQRDSREESRAPPWALQLGKLGFGANLEKAWLKCPGLTILLMLQEQERCQPAPVITSVGLACD